MSRDKRVPNHIFETLFYCNICFLLVILIIQDNFFVSSVDEESAAVLIFKCCSYFSGRFQNFVLYKKNSIIVRFNLFEFAYF